MVALVAILVVVVLPIALAERRRRRPVKAWTGYSPAVLYTRGGEPRWGVVGTWQRAAGWRQMRRRIRQLEARRARRSR